MAERVRVYVRVRECVPVRRIASGRRERLVLTGDAARPPRVQVPAAYA